MMSLLWYYRPEHLQGGRSPSMHEVRCLSRVSGRQGWEGEIVAPRTPYGEGAVGSEVIVTSDATNRPGF